MMAPGLINLLGNVGWQPWPKVAIIGVLALIAWLPLALIAWWLWF